MGNLQEEIDLKKTIEISARRFEESPYIELSLIHISEPTRR